MICSRTTCSVSIKLAHECAIRVTAIYVERKKCWEEPVAGPAGGIMVGRVKKLSGVRPVRLGLAIRISREPLSTSGAERRSGRLGFGQR